MLHAQATVLIRRPVDEVFPFVADREMSLQYWPGVVTIERTSGDDSGAGATYREVVKSGPVAMEVRFENTQFEHARTLSVVTTRPRAVQLRDVYTFEAVGAATRVTVDCQGRARGPLRALEPILERSLRLNHEESLGGLKRFLEAPRPVVPLGQRQRRVIPAAVEATVDPADPERDLERHVPGRGRSVRARSYADATRGQASRATPSRPASTAQPQR